MVLDGHWENAEYVNDDNIRIFLTTQPISISEGIDFVKTEGAGAVISFGGTTRDSFEGKGVEDLSYEAYHELALRTLTKITREAIAKFEDANKDECIHRVYLCHRLGVVPVKEESIVLCLSSTHRQEGWNCGIWMLDKIKERAEIWKKENYTDGSASWKENDNSNVQSRT